ncbi:V-type ATP synthase subunit I [Wenzhouxiangella limi]|uniref:ATPase n=1 Tax=Wenzhouxiangella limi TaxID=2707351 RepID=A0A845V7E7_9GAMM|nr:V-type ATPase 116kDa subunit family protein [Wenzhouxiangella limi]NDY97076.1 ATPase [Wenzhouxiangella limi]
MGLRPGTACWFELLVPRADLARTLARLAETQTVELETEQRPDRPFELPGLTAAVAEFNDLERRLSGWWPEGQLPSLDRSMDPVAAMEDALARLRVWAAEAEPLIDQAERHETELARLDELDRLVAGDNPALPAFERLAEAGPWLAARLYRLPPDSQPDDWPASILTQFLVDADGQRYVLAVGPDDAVSRLDERMTAIKARRLMMPAWLPDEPQAARNALAERRAQAEQARRQVGERIAELHERHQIAPALGVMALMQWFAGHAPALPMTEHFVLVTGWCSDPDGAELDRVLAESNVEHVLRRADPPAGLDVPVIMRNPRWAKPFEIFANLLGTPGSTEVDPSRLLAVITPLMFGFMFGDVGQGAVLLGLGLWLRKRIPVFALLVPFGAAAIVFGFLFGSIFANEHLIPALWMHPIDHPTTIMAIAVGFGVCVIATGLLFDALRCLWRGAGLHWLATRAGLVLAYFGILGALLRPELLNLAWLGFAWFVLGSVGVAERQRLMELPKALGELLEGMLQLLVNTISFVRVGAFALAHAGLSAAVFGMADAAGGGLAGLIVIILGNAIVIALEGLIVGIQTTRLMLFEFFIRFLTAEGRRFKPLTGPGAVFRPTGRSST